MVDPTISLYGIPFTSTILYSNEKGLINQNLKNINFRLDYQKLFSNIYQRISKDQQEIERLIKVENFNSGRKDLVGNQKYYLPDQLNLFKKLFSDYKEGINPENINTNLNIEKLNQYSLTKLIKLQDSLSEFQPTEYGKLDSILEVKSYLEMDEASFLKLRDSLHIADKDKLRHLEELRKINQARKFKGNDLNTNLSSLESTGLITKAERFFLNFKRFGIGDIYPVYSSLTLNGLKVRGVDVSYCPKDFYTAFTTGISYQVQYKSLLQYKQINRNLIAGGVGYGKKTGSHIHFNVLQAKEPLLGNDDTIQISNHKTNSVISADAAYELGNIKVTGEMAASALQGENTFTYSSDILNNKYNRSKPVLFDQVMEIAYQLGANYKIPLLKANLKAEIRRVPPRYKSYGVPYLRTDVLQYKAGVEKKFFKEQVIIDGFVMQEQDNLEKQKGYTSKLNSIGGNLNININRLPFLIVSYQPFSQTNQSILDSFIFRSSHNTLTVTSGYQRKIKEIYSLSTVSYIYQRENYIDQAFSSYNKIISINQMLKFNTRLMISGTVSNFISQFDSTELKANNYELSGSYLIGKRIVIMPGVMLNNSINSIQRHSAYLGFNYTLNSKNQVSAVFNKISLTSATRPDLNKNYYDIIIKYVIKW